MKKEELHLIEIGDEIDFRTIAFAGHEVVKGIETARVAGMTEGAALIHGRRFKVTIAVLAKDIVAVRRGLEAIYVDIDRQ